MLAVHAWLQSIASVATAVGVFIAVWQVWQSRELARTQFEDQLSAQYRELIQRMPVNALLGEPLSDEELTAALPEFVHYFDLSNEQAFLHRRRRVSDETWENWRDGILQNLRRPAFAAAWAHVSERATGSFDDLRSVLRDDVGSVSPRSVPSRVGHV